MKMIDKVLQQPEFANAPPVLVDVGASSGIHVAWRQIAKYSICIAFDADDRGMEGSRRDAKKYRRFHLYDRALTADDEETSDFYLTADAPCSSLLPPNEDALSQWEFADRFTVVARQRVATTNMQQVLGQLKLNYVDWFKTDSQGTDLRLFLSLGEPIARRVLVADFEPGILDAYRGEDKLWQVMARMDELGFWMSNMTVKGSNRLHKDVARAFTATERKYMVHLLKVSPGWVEATYLNSLTGNDFNKRELLLGWVIATLQRQHGFALEVSYRGQQQFRDSLFEDLQRSSLASIRRRYLNLPAYFPLAQRAFRRWRRLRTAAAM